MSIVATNLLFQNSKQERFNERATERCREHSSERN